MRINSVAMRQNFDAQKKRFPGLYRHDYLIRQRRLLGLTERETARRARVSEGSLKNAEKGKATQKIVFPIAVVVGADWRDLHDLTRPVEELGRVA